ncbi:hypothetical protein [Geomesophilobacter sediminis]|uniref:Uncharacterized protein n=1 Tax=Geomesophilobacter sediminis TaxID=2798584 RepID=A0A8J7M1J1_9BACT|nr:hypothetical protein [Geomesophilobacter sediminis]MBJ6726778.1 hypothetical protein [Geomesophilobacter sediminis]
MKHFRHLMLALAVLLPVSAHAGDVANLATCTTKTFADIFHNQAWSGKTPRGCFAKIAVAQKSGGIAVSAWIVEKKGEGYRQLSFTATQSMEELQNVKLVATANRDILNRAKRLERCLTPGKATAACQVTGHRDVQVDEESGVRDFKEISLGDGGRDTVVQSLVSDTDLTPTLPATIADEQPLPPGTELKVLTVR